MSFLSPFKPSRMIAAAIVCGLVTLDSTAVLGQGANPVIQLQPQTGATLKKAASQTVSRIQRQGFVPQNIQGLPKVSAEPIAPPSLAPQAARPAVPKLMPQSLKKLAPAVARTKPAARAGKNLSSIVNNSDSAIRNDG